MINGALAVVAVGLFVAGEVRQKARPNIEWHLVLWPLGAVSIWTLWMLIQTAPGAPAFFAHPVWSVLPPIGTQGANTISGSPGATWATIAQAVPTALLGFVAMRAAFRRERGEFLLKLIAGTSVAVAVYGLVAQHFHVEQVFLAPSDAYAGVVTGTFVGRNAAATYFIIGLAITTSLLATRAQASIEASRGHFWLSVGEMMRTGSPYLLGSLILAAAILKTGSRAGAAAAGVALLVIAASAVRAAGAGRRTVAGIILLISAILVVMVLAAGQILFQRLETDPGIADRLLVYRDTLGMIFSRPLLGHGAGAFGDLYPLFHNLASSRGVWNHAHDTYLQAAAELGLPVFALLVVTIIWLAVVILREIKPNRAAPVCLAALGALAGTAFHAILDFGLQVQAVGLTMAVLLGAGFGDALRLRRAGRESVEQPRQVVKVSVKERINVSVPTTGAG